MDHLNTFEESKVTDPLYAKQREDVAKMRASLLACNVDPSLARTAVNNIAVLRVYHQITRIIRYTELMDKLEDKLYESIDNTIDRLNPESQSTWMMLMNIQERLQKTMIESQKMLAPLKDLVEMDLTLDTESSYAQSTKSILDASARDNIRTKANAILVELNAAG